MVARTRKRRKLTETMSRSFLVVLILSIWFCVSAQASNLVSESIHPAGVPTDTNKPAVNAAPTRITVPQTVLPLPGSLDNIPVFYSNSPEIVSQSGILLSTFPPVGKAHPEAHLNYPLSGRFDVFFHHVAKKTSIAQTLYLALLVTNGADQRTHLRIHDAVSYRTIPDSPFKQLDSIIENKRGKIYAGPGDRVGLDLLRNRKQHGWHHHITLVPGQSKLLYMLPLSSGRTGALRIESDGAVYLASLATFAKSNGRGGENKPELADWQNVLNVQALVQPRDKTPSVPGAKGALIYGRVAGISNGSSWLGMITNDIDHSRLAISPGQSISFPISTIAGGTLGTHQVQAAPMLVRYPDTAYQAHGNYGVVYDLTALPYNDSDESRSVGITMQSPMKDWNNPSSLQFLDPPADHIFYRGTVKFEWIDERGKRRKKLVHLVEKQGQQVGPLIEMKLAPHEERQVRITFIYPADCTPPQVVTFTSLSESQ